MTSAVEAPVATAVPSSVLAPTSDLPAPVAALRSGGVSQTEIAVDYHREGRLTVPGAPTYSLSLAEAAKAGLSLTKAMDLLATRPASGKAPTPGLVHVFIPGLNSEAPEAADRLQNYVNLMDEPMLHMANGTGMSLGNKGILPASARDWVSALRTFLGVEKPRLANSVNELLTAAWQEQPRPKVRLTAYSDGTIGVGQGIEAFVKGEVGRQAEALRAQGKPVNTKQLDAEVRAQLKESVFVELYGNALNALPKGPKYMVFSDFHDPVTFMLDPGSNTGRVGCSEHYPDPKNPDAAYVDFLGPFSDLKSNAHNMAGNTSPMVKEILQRAGAKDTEELYEMLKAGKQVSIPSPDEVKGNRQYKW